MSEVLDNTNAFLEIPIGTVSKTEALSIAKKKKFCIIQLREASYDPMTTDPHAGMLSGNPMLLPMDYSDAAGMIFTTVEQFLDFVDKNDCYDIKFSILLGFGTSGLADNDVVATKRFLSKIVNHPILPQTEIVFINGWDLYSNDDNHHTPRTTRYSEILAEFPHKQVKFLLCNPYVLEKLKFVMPEIHTEYYVIYPFRMMLTLNSTTHPKFFNNGTNIGKHRTRKLICLNNYNKSHRQRIVNKIAEYDPSMYLYTLRDDNILLPSEQKLVSTLASIGDRANIIVDNTQDSPPLRYMLDAYTYIATETYGDDEMFITPGQPGIAEAVPIRGWWSEKTLKAMYYELPFMVVGLPETLKYLREVGFETFPELFDESYDSSFDSEKRFNIFYNNIDKIMSMSYDDLHDFYYSARTQQKLTHNKQLLLSLVFSKSLSPNINTFMENFLARE